MREVVEVVENFVTEGGWHNWTSVTGLRFADQITGAVGNGLLLEMGSIG